MKENSVGILFRVDNGTGLQHLVAAGYELLAVELPKRAVTEKMGRPQQRGANEVQLYQGYRSTIICQTQLTS